MLTATKAPVEEAVAQIEEVEARGKKDIVSSKQCYIYKWGEPMPGISNRD